MSDPTDIVEILRSGWPIERNAVADEIVKLREDRDRLRQTANGLAGCVTIRNAHVEDRDAEIVKLRLREKRIYASCMEHQGSVLSMKIRGWIDE
jgi:hypothetical protein